MCGGVVVSKQKSPALFLDVLESSNNQYNKFRFIFHFIALVLRSCQCPSSSSSSLNDCKVVDTSRESSSCILVVASMIAAISGDERRMIGIVQASFYETAFQMIRMLHCHFDRITNCNKRNIIMLWRRRSKATRKKSSSSWSHVVFVAINKNNISWHEDSRIMLLLLIQYHHQHVASGSFNGAPHLS
jgi:hypothetical protein